MHNHSIQIDHFPTLYIAWIDEQFTATSSPCRLWILCVKPYEMFLCKNHSGSWKFPSPELQFCTILLKLCICVKALHMGLSHTYHWSDCGPSWSASWQEVAWDNAGDDNQNCHILTFLLMVSICCVFHIIISTVVLCSVKIYQFLQRSRGLYPLFSFLF